MPHGGFAALAAVKHWLPPHTLPQTTIDASGVCRIPHTTYGRITLLERGCVSHGPGGSFPAPLELHPLCWDIALALPQPPTGRELPFAVFIWGLQWV